MTDAVGNQVKTMRVDAARRLTERIRQTAHNARESIVKLHGLVEEARQGSAHVVLGYASWTAYLSEVLSEEPLRLAREPRQELVGYLAGEGMSTRAIAPIVGVDQKTVRRDIAGEADASPEPEPEVVEAEVMSEPELATVTGLDGKSYSRPAAKPRRRPLIDDARDAGDRLRRAVNALERVAADDRFSRNRPEVAAQLRHHLDRAIEVCQHLRSEIDTQ